MTSDKHYCCVCNEDCDIEPEEIHYSGTHCTNGNGGVHKTGFYYSVCCGAEFLTYDENDNIGNSNDE